MVDYLYLVIAIVAEVIATSALKASDGFAKLPFLAIMGIGYAIAFYFLALSIRTIPVGIAYGIWSAIGIVLIAAVGAVWFRQPLDLPAAIGLGLIIAGVVVVNVFSHMAAH
jgi:small multidrug resistance pump